MKKLALVLSLLALGALGLVACGGDDDETTTAAETETTTAAETETTTAAEGESVALEADPNGALAYVQSSLDAPAGAVTIEFDNPSSTGHDVVVEDADGTEITRTDVISEDSATGHREAGMEGTLTAE